LHRNIAGVIISPDYYFPEYKRKFLMRKQQEHENIINRLYVKVLFLERYLYLESYILRGNQVNTVIDCKEIYQVLYKNL